MNEIRKTRDRELGNFRVLNRCRPDRIRVQEPDKIGKIGYVVNFGSRAIRTTNGNDDDHFPDLVEPTCSKDSMGDVCILCVLLRAANVILCCVR